MLACMGCQGPIMVGRLCIHCREEAHKRDQANSILFFNWSIRFLRPRTKKGEWGAQVTAPHNRVLLSPT